MDTTTNTGQERQQDCDDQGHLFLGVGYLANLSQTAYCRTGCHRLADKCNVILLCDASAVAGWIWYKVDTMFYSFRQYSQGAALEKYLCWRIYLPYFFESSVFPSILPPFIYLFSSSLMFNWNSIILNWTGINHSLFSPSIVVFSLRLFYTLDISFICCDRETWVTSCIK